MLSDLAATSETRPSSDTLRFALFASIIPTFLGGSSAPTPLYAIYREAWGFSPITITVIFAVYAIVVLVTLLFLGALSDRIGRRPVLIASALLQIVAMALFATADDVTSLIVARVVQGISAGAATGAAGAALLDVDRERGTVANAVAPTLGTALGGIVSGLMVAFLPAPTVLVYVVFGVVFLLQTIALLFVRETTSPTPFRLEALRPRIAVPPAVRGPLLWALPAIVAAWAVPGFFGSLGPLLVQHVLGVRSPLWGGLALFVMASSAALGVFLSRTRSARLAMQLGALALAIGVALLWLSIGATSAAIFFAGCVISGLGFGASFQGTVRSLVMVAKEHERAGVLSVLYIAAYLALGAPAVLGGIGAVYGGGLVATSETFTLTVAILAALAFVGSLRPAPTNVLAPSASNP